MSPKRQRLYLVVAGVGAVAGATALGLSAMGDRATYFYAPSDIAARPPEPGREVRLGGLVEPGSRRILVDGVTTAFTVTDNRAVTPVTYKGIVPDLFREGSGVIATGSFVGRGGTFVASEILAKHDEKYMPPEIEGTLHKTGKVER